MMTEALVIAHTWSLIVAGGAWFMQRDGEGRVGAHFPNPNIWLALIALCALPVILCAIPFGAAIQLPDMEIFGLISTRVNESSPEATASPRYIMAYLSLSGVLISRTLWRWLRLQRLPLTPTVDTRVFTTAADLPPLTLSWPRRAIVIPDGFETEVALIRHENAHLRRNDAELTLLLLIVQDLMLRSPGISYLVHQWRLSVELRADHEATKMLGRVERKRYAALLLSFQRPTGSNRETLPSPTARMNSRRQRTAKLRLGRIITNEPNTSERRWFVALLVTFFGASAIGFLSAAALADVEGSKNRLRNTGYVQVTYVKQTPLHSPTRCQGIDPHKLKTKRAEIVVDGESIFGYAIDLGTVILSHDTRKDGSVYNPRVIDSTHPCFEANAIASISQWVAQPRDLGTKNVAVKLHFSLAAERLEELDSKLNAFLL